MAPPARRAWAEMLPGLRPRVSPIAVVEACRAAVMAVLGTRRQRCRSKTEQRGVSAGAPRDRRYRTRRRMTRSGHAVPWPEAPCPMASPRTPFFWVVK
jgi:hypothetical protein